MSAARRPSPQKKNTPADAGTSRGQVSSEGLSTGENVAANDDADNPVHVGEVVVAPDGSRQVVATLSGFVHHVSADQRGRLLVEDEDVAALLKTSVSRLRERTAELRAEDPKNFNPFEFVPSREGKSARGRPTKRAFRYTEHQALFLISQTETKIARRMTHHMIRVFIAVRDQLVQSAVAKDAPPSKTFEARAAYANKFVAAIMSKVTATSIHDEQSVRSAIQQGAVMASGVAGRPWGEWTEEELVRVVAQLRFVDSMVDALAKRVAHREIAEKSPTPVFTINIAQLALFDSPWTAAMGGAK